MYCTACGTQNSDEARFCTRCGEPTGDPQAPSQPPAVSPSTQSNRPSNSSGMRTATLILGLIAATILLFGGCSAYVTGSFFEGVEEIFETELDEPDGGVTSTTEDVSNAGGFAIFTAILLYLGAGLARAALKTSFALLVLTMFMLIGLVVIDTTSLFAAFYYLATALVATSVILMGIAYMRSRRSTLGEA